MICHTGQSVNPTGIFRGPHHKRAFIEDGNTGDLLYCVGGTATIIATPPPGGSGRGYLGMAGLVDVHGRTLVLSSWATGPGLWFCYNATRTHCGSESKFINLPSAFCSSRMPSGRCVPIGIALDTNLDVYYADDLNAVVAKCTEASGYQSCSVVETLSAEPTGIFLDKSGNVWVSDASCAGKVWENGVVSYKVGESLGGITVDKYGRLFVGVSGFCENVPGHLLDLTDGISFNSPLSGPDLIIGLADKLQFTANSTLAVFNQQL